MLKNVTRPPQAKAVHSAILPRDTLDEVTILAIARQRRADYLKALTAARGSSGRWSHVPMVAATTLAGAALVVVCAALLSLGGVPTSVAIMAAVLLAATLSSIAGFAFSAICGVMLLHMMDDPVQVVMVMMVCSIAIQSLSVAVLWRDIDWRALAPFLAGGIAGLPIGVWLLLHLGNAGFKEMVGGLLIAYALYGLLKRPMVIHHDGKLVDVCVGFLGGVTGGLAGFPGVPVTVWCGLRGWEKWRQRGIYQPFILAMQLLALPLIHLMRSSWSPGAGVGIDIVQFVPAALLGTWFGLSLCRRLSDKTFTLAVNSLLLVSGLGLLV